MEGEKHNKITLSTYIAVLAVLVIIVMAVLLYMQKINSNREIEGLKNDSEVLKNTVAELQGKLDSINEITNNTTNENSNTNQTSNEEFVIEGTYESNAGLEKISYTFSNGKVEYESLGKNAGTYEIDGNKISIKYNKQHIDPDGKTINNEYLNGESEVLTIENDKTIVNKNGTKFVKE